MQTARSVIISQLRMQPPSSGSQMHCVSPPHVGSSARSVQVGISPVSPLLLLVSTPLLSLLSSLEAPLDSLVEVSVDDIVVDVVGAFVVLLDSLALACVDEPSSSSSAGQPASAVTESTAGIHNRPFPRKPCMGRI